MKAPTWAVIVGIFMILFGTCSVSNSVQSINTPKMLEMQQEMMNNMTKNFGKIPSDSLYNSELDSLLENSSEANSNEAFNGMQQTMQKMFHMSDFVKKWTVRFGYIGMFVSLIYILGGIFLFVIKPFSLKLVFSALILSIIFAITQMMVLTSEPSSGFMALASGYSKVFGIVIDIIFLVVIASMEKTSYVLTAETE